MTGKQLLEAIDSTVLDGLTDTQKLAIINDSLRSLANCLKDNYSSSSLQVDNGHPPVLQDETFTLDVCPPVTVTLVSAPANPRMGTTVYSIFEVATTSPRVISSVAIRGGNPYAMTLSYSGDNGATWAGSITPADSVLVRVAHLATTDGDYAVSIKATSDCGATAVGSSSYNVPFTCPSVLVDQVEEGEVVSGDIAVSTFVVSTDSPAKISSVRIVSGKYSNTYLTFSSDGGFNYNETLVPSDVVHCRLVETHTPILGDFQAVVEAISDCGNKMQAAIGWTVKEADFCPDVVWSGVDSHTFYRNGEDQEVNLRVFLYPFHREEEITITPPNSVSGVTVQYSGSSVVDPATLEPLWFNTPPANESTYIDVKVKIDADVISQGTHVLNFGASNICGSSDTHTLTLTALAPLSINRPPYVSIRIPVIYGEVGDATYTLDLTTYWADADGDTLTFTYETFGDDGATAINQYGGNGEFLDIDFIGTGEKIVQVWADDGVNPPVASNFTTQSSYPASDNQPPYVSTPIPVQEMLVDSAPFTIDLTTVFTDPESLVMEFEAADTITKYAKNTPQVLFVRNTGVGGRLLEVTPLGIAGDDEVEIRCKDSYNDDVLYYVRFKVRDPATGDPAPYIENPIPDQFLTYPMPFDPANPNWASATFYTPDHFGTLDNVAASTTAVSSAPGVVEAECLGPGGWVLFVTPKSAGTATVTVYADDGVNPPVPMSFTVTIAAANSVPQITPVSFATADAGTYYVYVKSVGDAIDYADIETMIPVKPYGTGEGTPIWTVSLEKSDDDVTYSADDGASHQYFRFVITQAGSGGTTVSGSFIIKATNTSGVNQRTINYYAV